MTGERLRAPALAATLVGVTFVRIRGSGREDPRASRAGGRASDNSPFRQLTALSGPGPSCANSCGNAVSIFCSFTILTDCLEGSDTNCFCSRSSSARM